MLSAPYLPITSENYLKMRAPTKTTYRQNDPKCEHQQQQTTTIQAKAENEKDARVCVCDANGMQRKAKAN